jgi:UDP-glucose 4-epimerase/UDP-arabinose 4-epimerase
MKATVLVTGGAGFIGSHTAKALAEAGWRPVVFDNLSSGQRSAVQWGEFVHGDIRDSQALREVIDRYGVQGVIHFAGLIEVGRSMSKPDLFYDHNVGGTAALLSAMKAQGVPRLVFSSSAAVYGAYQGPTVGAAIPENAAKTPSSPYGETKLVGEWMIEAQCRAFGLRGIALRYFNAAGADPSGLIGEAHDPETHLIPLTIDAALGRGGPLTVFGRDFDTPDGSCLRDYIHVSDLARAHVAALSTPMDAGAFLALNVGTGQGYSVLEVIGAVDAAMGRPTPVVIGPRRAGDPASLVADASLIRRRFDWSARESSLDHIVETALRWRRDRPHSRQS